MRRPTQGKGLDRLRMSALAVLALLYGWGLADYGAVTPEGRARFTLLTLLVTALVGVACAREGALWIPNRRSLLMGALLWLAALLSVPHSIWPEASSRGALLGIHFILLYLTLLHVLGNRQVLQGFIWGLLLWGVTLSIWGIAQRVGAGGNVTGGYLGWGHAGSFVNRNHFASLVGMLVPLGLYSALGLRSRTVHEQPIMAKPWTYLVAAFCLLISLVLTLSLGGFLALIVLILAMGTDRLLSRGSRSAHPLWAGLILLIATTALLVAWFGHEPLTERLARAGAGGEASAAERIAFWQAAVKIWLSHPIGGTGPATFAHAFAGYRPEGIAYRVQFAHNEWLQLLAEGGLIGLLLVGGLLAAFFSYAFDPSQPVRDNYYRRVMRGAALGLLFVGVHSLVDFPIRIPANAAVVIALAAIVTTAASHRASGGGAAVSLPESPLTRGALLLGLVASLVTIGSMDVRLLLAERSARVAGEELAEGDAALALSEATRASRLRPRSDEYHHLRARALMAQAGRAPVVTQKEHLLREAHNALDQAVAAAPLWPRYWTDRGALAERLNERELAEQDLLRAVELGPNDPYPLFERGRQHWRQGRFALAALDLRRAQEIEPRFGGKVITLYRETTGGRASDLELLASVLEAGVPDTRNGHLALASLYRDAGMEEAYRQQLQRAYHKDPDNAGLLAKLFAALTDAGKHETAREQLLHYTQRHPDDAAALFLLGRAQANTDRWADAIEAYSASLALRPDQPDVYRELEKTQEFLGQTSGYRFWQPLAARFPGNPAYNYELGLRYAELDRWIEAVQELKLAIGKDPTNVTFRNKLAEFYVKRRLFNEAIAQWEEVATLQPESVQPLLQIARTYQRLKLPNRARPYYERILSLNPNHKEARRFLTEHAG